MAFAVCCFFALTANPSFIPIQASPWSCSRQCPSATVCICTVCPPNEWPSFADFGMPLTAPHLGPIGQELIPPSLHGKRPIHSIIVASQGLAWTLRNRASTLSLIAMFRSVHGRTKRRETFPFSSHWPKFACARVASAAAFPAPALSALPTRLMGRQWAWALAFGGPANERSWEKHNGDALKDG